MEYNFDEKIKGYFEIEAAKINDAINERSGVVNPIELNGLVGGMIVKGLSVILQDYHEQLMKEIPKISMKSFGKLL